MKELPQEINETGKGKNVLTLFKNAEILAPTKSAFSVCLILILTIPSRLCASDLLDTARLYFTPLPHISTESERFTPAQIDLGKALYFDPRISASGHTSCNSCHNLALGGDGTSETVHGHGWQTAPRNAPTILNSAFNETHFWDGHVDDVIKLAKGLIRTNVELTNTPESLVSTLLEYPKYVEWFAKAFPDQDEPIAFENAALAIEAFKSTLITPAPFDFFLRGNEDALSKKEKEGLVLFMEAGCSSCHNGINIGGHDYYPFALADASGLDFSPIGYRGSLAIQETEDPEYVFRAAPLRNVSLTAPYFHSGKVSDLEEAVKTMADINLHITLSDEDIHKISSFLHSLTGELEPIEIPTLPVKVPPRPFILVD